MPPSAHRHASSPSSRCRCSSGPRPDLPEPLLVADGDRGEHAVRLTLADGVAPLVESGDAPARLQVAIEERRRRRPRPRCRRRRAAGAATCGADEHGAARRRAPPPTPAMHVDSCRHLVAPSPASTVAAAARLGTTAADHAVAEHRHVEGGEGDVVRASPRPGSGRGRRRRRRRGPRSPPASAPPGAAGVRRSPTLRRDDEAPGAPPQRRGTWRGRGSRTSTSPASRRRTCTARRRRSPPSPATGRSTGRRRRGSCRRRRRRAAGRR